MTIWIVLFLIGVYIFGQLICLMIPGGLVIWPIFFLYFVGREFVKK